MLYTSSEDGPSSEPSKSAEGGEGEVGILEQRCVTAGPEPHLEPSPSTFRPCAAQEEAPWAHRGEKTARVWADGWAQTV